MSEELKPCPFCGSTLLGMSQTGIYWGRCDSCHCEGPTEDTEAEAIAAWNRRAQPEPAASAAVMVGLSKEDVSYPCDLFAALIEGNSPYAFYLFQWVPYQTDAKRWRLKMLHDVRSFDGREAHGIWPNGTSCGPFRDDEVEFIRISRKQWGEEWTGPQPAPNVLPPSEPAASASTCGLTECNGKPMCPRCLSWQASDAAPSVAPEPVALTVAFGYADEEAIACFCGD